MVSFLAYLTEQYINEVDGIVEERWKLSNCYICINGIVDEVSRHIVTIWSTATLLTDQLWNE